MRMNIESSKESKTCIISTVTKGGERHSRNLYITFDRNYNKKRLQFST